MKFDKCHLNLKILLGWRVYLDRTFFLNIYFWINFILKGECRELKKKTQKKKKSLGQICADLISSLVFDKKSKNMTRENP